MPTSELNGLLSVLDSNGIHYEVDKNPSNDKIARIKQSIARKADLYKTAIDKYTRSRNVNV